MLYDDKSGAIANMKIIEKWGTGSPDYVKLAKKYELPKLEHIGSSKKGTWVIHE